MRIQRSLTQRFNRPPLPLPKTTSLLTSSDLSRLSESNRVLVKVADAGNAEDCFNLAQNLIEGKNGFRENFEAGLRYLKRSVDSDNVDAINYYADMLTTGVYLPSNLELAAEIYEKGVEKRSSESMVRLAMLKKRNNKDDPEALQLIKDAANLENPEALFLYGKHLREDGQTEQAILYYKLSCDKGFPRGMNAYAVALENGWGVQKNEQEAAKLYRMAAKKECPEAMLNFAYMLEEGKGGLKQDLKKALKYYKMAYDFDDVDGLVNYAYMVEYGRGTKRKPQKAKRLYLKAIHRKSAQAMNRLGEMYRDGHGIQQDVAKALVYFKYSSEFGSEEGKTNFDYLMKDLNPKDDVLNHKIALSSDEEEGDDSESYDSDSYDDDSEEEDNDEGEQYLIQPVSKKMLDLNSTKKPSLNDVYNIKVKADEGDLKSILKYADLLEKGDVIQQNLTDSALYYESAAKANSPEGCYRYACMLFDGKGVQKNQHKAARYFKKASDKGLVKAMVKFGELCQHGIGVKKTYSEAARQYKKAIELKSTEAMVDYASMFATGSGVKKNYSKAAQYAKMAADDGNLDGQALYGEMLLKQNPSKNAKEAISCIKSASDAGNINGMIKYSEVLEQGTGVQKDLKNALKLAKKAADTLNPQACFNYASILERNKGDPGLIKENYKRGSDQGHIPSIMKYVTLITNTKHITKYLTVAAEEGNVDAMVKLGKMTNDFSLLKKAADQGTSISAILLYSKYCYDKTLELKYLKIAADKGNIEGMTRYSRKVHKVNPEESATYAKMAADAGDVKAMMKYAKMCENGDGVPPNIKRALRYYRKAKNKGNKEAEEIYNQLKQQK